MITVKLPDGSTAQFPDGTPPDVMKRAIQKRFPPAATEAVAPEGLVPGSPDYAKWAAEQARAGKKLPQVSEAPPEWEDPRTPQARYDRSLQTIRERYYPQLTDEQWQKAIDEKWLNLQPHDAGDLFAEGLRWNLGDEAAGAAGAVSNLFNNPGQAFQDYQEFEQARRALGQEQSGLLGTGAEIAGTALSGGLATGATKPATAVQAGLDAAKQGGTYGFLASEGDLVDRGTGAATGAAISGPLGAGVQKGVNALGQRAVTKTAPTAAQIKQSSQAAFRQMEAANATIKQPALDGLNNGMRQMMQREGIILPSGKVDSSFGRIASALDTIDEFSRGPMVQGLNMRAATDLNMKQAQTVWRSLRRAAGSTDPTEARLGMKMLDAFENWMDNLPPSAVSGKVDEAFNAWAKGKSEWARFKKVGVLETAIDKAKRAKGGFAAGLRSQFNSILNSPKKQRGFTKAELDAMRKFAEGGTMQKIVDLAAAFKGIPGAAALFGATGGNLPIALAGWGAALGAKSLVNQGGKSVANKMRVNAALPGGVPTTLPNMSPAQDVTRRLARGGQSQLVRQ